MKINDLRYSKESNKKALQVWLSMHARCYSESQLKNRKKYEDCSVCEEWHSFSSFLKWYEENYIEGNALDKDILVKGNKVYSPDTCAFVPNHINNLIGLKGCTLPIYKHGNRFRYHLKTANGLQKESFNTMEEAIDAYCKAKELRVYEVALQSFLANEIRSDVYVALKNWKVLDE